MTKTVNKMFFAWQIPQEKAFLEDMARQGYFLTGCLFGKYIFEKKEPREVVYDFDFQVLHKNEEEEYLSLVEGWTYATRYGSWYYFYKNKSLGEPYSVYTNNQSRQAMFRRLLIFLVIVGVPLYMNLLVIFPNQPAVEFEPFKFYFFFRILTFILVGLHLYASLKVLYMIQRYRASISE
jgi:hypothetical protein